MFGKSIRLFSLFGFEVKVDASWAIIAFLVTWSLAEGFFPMRVRGLAGSTYWWMGVAGAIGLFLSIVFHELCHSLVARRFGLAMRGITLFIFGGVAEMAGEPPSPKAEFLMALAGPLASIALAAGCYGAFVSAAGAWPVPITEVLYYLAFINGLLAAFNLIPAFPLDGGRLLRAALWSWKHNIRWSTRIASAIGSGFGVFLIVLGIYAAAFRGNFIGGMWWFLIGLFLRNASQASYQQLLVRRALEGEQVRRFMRPDPVTVPSYISLRELVEDYIYRYHYKMFPVVRESRLVGCVTTDEVKNFPRDEWDRHSVQEVATGCSKGNTVSPDTDAVQALATMNRTGNTRLMVIEDGRLVGIVSLKDLLAFLSLKIDLEGHRSA
jgi:Zn-dependent protease